MKKIAVFIVVMTLLLNGLAVGVYAETPTPGKALPRKIMVYLKPDITVELNGVNQLFRNAKGQTVHPIIFNGSTYLPVRAISSLMKESVEWDGGSRSVFIGKTFSNPNKTTALVDTSYAVPLKENVSLIKPAQSMVSAHLRPDVLVFYDFTLHAFQDANEKTVYPIIYNGSTYLPVRAISKLMNKPIDWDGSQQKVIIGDGEEEAEDPIQEKPVEVISTASAIIADIFEREEALYYEATAKIANITSAASTEEKQIIASSTSENYLSAQHLTAEAKAVVLDSFTEEEKNACSTLVAFAESTEYYILVLENIAYLAAEDADYSMLADTFLYFAMEAQTKMEAARPKTER